MKDVAAVRSRVAALGGRIALVPTMGALHEGHLALVSAARAAADRVVVSIFVNPLQFGPSEDLDRYPRDLAGDADKLRAAGVDLLFAPEVSAMYPPDFATEVRVEALSHDLCGAHRPGHFAGVATVVLKLLLLVRPDVAVFGEKDLQQLTLIRRMVKDLMVPTEILGAPIVRAPDGLALSSRNAYLSEEERVRARSLYAGLQGAHQAFSGGVSDAERLSAIVRAHLARAGLEPEYVALRDLDTWTAPTVATAAHAILAAVQVGSTRLIDNVLLGRPLA